jgi:hypothetical protein
MTSHDGYFLVAQVDIKCVEEILGTGIVSTTARFTVSGNFHDASGVNWKEIAGDRGHGRERGR